MTFVIQLMRRSRSGNPTNRFVLSFDSPMIYNGFNTVLLHLKLCRIGRPSTGVTFFGGPKGALNARFFKERNPLKEGPSNISNKMMVSCKIKFRRKDFWKGKNIDTYPPRDCLSSLQGAQKELAESYTGMGGRGVMRILKMAHLANEISFGRCC